MKANHRIHLCLAKMSDNGMEQKYIQEAFQTNWVAPLGPNVDGFEKDLEDYLNEIPHHPSTSSGAVRNEGTACDEGFDSNFWLTTILFKQDLDTEALCMKLDQHGIEARPLWKPMHLQPVYKDAPAYTNGVSEKLYKTGICLPSGPWVTDDDIKYIVETIHKLSNPTPPL